VYSCDFLVAPETFLGNLHQVPLHQAFTSPAHLAFGRRKADYGEECQQCRWLSMCYGGCTKDRMHDLRDHGHNHFCASYKEFFSASESAFKELAALYHQYY
jgi:uncharacterized protein